MSRHDPTLPRPETDTLPEADLIARVKGEQDSAAILALVNRHTGIYFNVVNRYAAAYPNAIKARDLDDDKLFNIYQFVLAFDPTRGMKLSTYIGDRTDYLCKGILKRDERNPISPGTYSSTGSMPIDVDDDTYSTTNGGHVTLADESKGGHVAEVANTDLAVEDILKTAHEVNDDPRFFRIWDYRHNKGMSWRQIGTKMGISHEGCRTHIYQETLDKVKERLTA